MAAQYAKLINVLAAVSYSAITLTLAPIAYSS
jgi:hypothetical protein